jgi:hypothetical protein
LLIESFATLLVIKTRSRPRRVAHDLANRLLDPLIQTVSALPVRSTDTSWGVVGEEAGYSGMGVNSLMKLPVGGKF